MKKLGKASLKRHYGIFVMACLIAAFLGVEFGGSLTFSEAQTYEDTAQQIRNDWYGDGTYTVKTTVGDVSWGTVLRAIAEGDTQAGKDVATECLRHQRHTRGHPGGQGRGPADRGGGDRPG